MRAFVLVICSALALTGCTTVVVESVPSETRTLSPSELQNQTNQFECNELNLVFEEFYIETLWSGENPVLAATFYEPFSARKNKTASDIANWMNLAITSYTEFLSYPGSGESEDLTWSEASLAQYRDLQATCSGAGVPLLGVPFLDEAY
tara:strand:+ start:137 stop:583 length:447 start_codon:yes stop_codon:yes gene_type:complete